MDSITLSICPRVVSFGENLNLNSAGDEGFVQGIHMNANEMLRKRIKYSKAVYLLDKERRQRDRFNQDVKVDSLLSKSQNSSSEFAINNDDTDSNQFKVEKAKEDLQRQKKKDLKLQQAKEEYLNLKKQSENKKAYEIYQKPLEKNETHDDSKIKDIPLQPQNE